MNPSFTDVRNARGAGVIFRRNGKVIGRARAASQPKAAPFRSTTLYLLKDELNLWHYRDEGYPRGVW